jgi:hypothetical protein
MASKSHCNVSCIVRDESLSNQDGRLDSRLPEKGWFDVGLDESRKTNLSVRGAFPKPHIILDFRRTSASQIPERNPGTKDTRGTARN